MPQTYPEEVKMTANLRNIIAPAAIPTAIKSMDGIGKFAVNTLDKVVTFELDPQLESYKVAIHGFVPRGWKTDRLVELEPGQKNGTWNYLRSQEKNILDGLAYLSIRAEGSESPEFTAQIEPDFREEPKFEDYVSITAMAGACQARMTIFGQFEDVEMVMEPAQVIIARSAAVTRSDGRREQEIGCAIRVGGAYIEGIGRVEIGMFGDRNPGKIISMTSKSDFPARMTLDVRKSYISPAGSFYRDNEEFAADGIKRFPPFGVKFYPTEPIAPLREARTGKIVGQINLGWLVPLCHLDPGETEFPSKAVASARFEEEEVI